jgi:cytochrome P450
MTYLLALNYAPSPVFKIVVAAISWHPGARSMYAAFTIEKISLRLAEKTKRRDFITPSLKAKNDKGVLNAELESSANLHVLAGSGTLATSFAGAIYYLCKNGHA